MSFTILYRVPTEGKSLFDIYELAKQIRALSVNQNPKPDCSFDLPDPRMLQKLNVFIKNRPLGFNFIVQDIETLFELVKENIDHIVYIAVHKRNPNWNKNPNDNYSLEISKPLGKNRKDSMSLHFSLIGDTMKKKIKFAKYLQILTDNKVIHIPDDVSIISDNFIKLNSYKEHYQHGTWTYSPSKNIKLTASSWGGIGYFEPDPKFVFETIDLDMIKRIDSVLKHTILPECTQYTAICSIRLPGINPFLSYEKEENIEIDHMDIQESDILKIFQIFQNEDKNTFTISWGGDRWFDFARCEHAWLRIFFNIDHDFNYKPGKIFLVLGIGHRSDTPALVEHIENKLGLKLEYLGPQ